jgi:CBS domain
MAEIPSQLLLIQEQVDKGQTPTATVRELLSWFGFYRRSWRNAEKIRDSLRSIRLGTVPNFEYEYIDGAIMFTTDTDAESKNTISVMVTTTSTTTTPDGNSAGTQDGKGIAIPQLSIPDRDPTHRIGRLQSANTKPITVNQEQSINEAITLMMIHDFSQLPVMVGERDVKGIISWKSIGIRIAMNKEASKVKDCMEDCVTVSAEQSVFDLIPQIISSNCVLVRDAHKRITGLVTVSDISEMYGELSGPFLLLSEIENSIRVLIRPKLDVADLQSAKDPGDTNRTVQSVGDLSFGEYVRLLGNPAIWTKIALGIDRKSFIETLGTVRDIRNDVMHFDPDKIGDEELLKLQSFTSFLRQLRRLVNE